MYADLDEESKELILILKLIHDDLKLIDENSAYYVEDKMMNIIDYKGNILYKCQKDLSIICGTFVIETDTNYNRTIYSCRGRKSLRLGSKYCGNMYKVQMHPIGTDFIALCSNYSDFKILNKDLEFVGELVDVNSKIITTEDTQNGSRFTYRTSATWRKGYADKKLGKVTVFDSYELNKVPGFSLIATEYDDRSFSVAHENQSNLMYRLSVGDKLIGAEYCDIIKTDDLLSTDYLKVYKFREDENNSVFKSREKPQGIMNIRGVELIPPLYDDIMYLGNDTFILEYKDTRQIFSLRDGSIVAPMGKDKINVSSILPFVTIYNSDKNEVDILDFKGNKFGLADLPKYFKCEYNSESPDIMRVHNGVTYKYMYTNLVPITNLHAVAQLSLAEWIPM